MLSFASVEEWQKALHTNMERIEFVESQMSESVELERDYHSEWESLWDEFDDLWNAVDADWIPSWDRQ